MLLQCPPIFGYHHHFFLVGRMAHDPYASPSEAWLKVCYSAQRSLFEAFGVSLLEPKPLFLPSQGGPEAQEWATVATLLSREGSSVWTPGLQLVSEPSKLSVRKGSPSSASQGGCCSCCAGAAWSTFWRSFFVLVKIGRVLFREDFMRCFVATISLAVTDYFVRFTGLSGRSLITKMWGNEFRIGHYSRRMWTYFLLVLWTWLLTVTALVVLIGLFRIYFF